ncbi:hypothetical protein PVAG01_10777 [Phlyctema vagabunda]|uniref:Uncharacterized protein n=1 Tax=Phlyctema vagabunda TaxID=108571 RepID=A0ABR4P379_9HELO
MRFQTFILTVTVLAAGAFAAPVATQDISVIEVRTIVAPDAYSTRSKWTARIEYRDALMDLDERDAKAEAGPENVVDCCYSTRSRWTAEDDGSEES